MYCVLFCISQWDKFEGYFNKDGYKVKGLFYLMLSWKLNFHDSLCQEDYLHFVRTFAEEF